MPRAAFKRSRVRQPKPAIAPDETYAEHQYRTAREWLAKLQYEATVAPNPRLLPRIKSAQIEVGLWEGRLKEGTDL